MTLEGHSLIAGEAIPGTNGTTNGFNPATNEHLQPAYTLISEQQLRVATEAAADAFDSFSALAPLQHARFLEAIAENIEAVGDELVERASAETGLGLDRLRGERARTIGQLRLFADVVRQGDFRGVRIDPALPDRTPLPRADIRQQQIPLGPVAVFGASNFPLAFSVAGGDTASAFAAGCPVIVKAHNAHPGTAELVGKAITQAVKDLGLHSGVFSLVYGSGSSIGQALVADPAIKAVGFTGSRSGGTALMRTAAARPEPIPVYAEMSSINPVYVFDGALAGDVDTLAKQYVASVTGSSGQLCTSPGLVFVPAGEAGDRFAAAVTGHITPLHGQTMLTGGIAAAWQHGYNALEGVADVELLGRGSAGPGENAPAPAVFSADLDVFTHNKILHEEIFGAASLVIRYKDVDDLVSATNKLDGQLTASLHLSEDDYASAAPLVPALERKVGRIIINSWPTGVEVSHAMVHGGPYPATSDSKTTSVGTLAIERFLRPVAYQNFPEELRPAPLKDANPWKVRRLIDGEPVM
ncbi:MULTISPECIES: aldehyde dehydrogenase (NADP(+)) [Arthrobacter]|uniref:Aldehyde dehydrogenase (NADP(+)) n=1 Tax=Arthrobacter terricola TaxID=2547396 RepID=A0A4R5K7K2_9MICC|nr:MULTISPECIES: aldehyde dehydrogenase (NADP(+)) [Arthrobacter]MBT8163403.1 aldehyde dehydrogenase (NADP(+)) [Arthrobacter sp. GN70]TDF90129.1 aldehyde dehydrogenase (NADP(+)) [Arthrobacter terricola]